MASDAVYDAVRGYLASNWSETPIAWENEAFTRPEPMAPWLAVEIAGSLYSQESIGADTQAANRWDEAGTLFLHVFVPAGTGSSTARRHCKTLADLFRGARLIGDALEFMDASIGLGEPGDEEGTTYRISVSVDWRHEGA